MKNKLLKIFNWYGAKHQLKKLKEEQKEVRQAIRWYETIRKCEPNEEIQIAYKSHIAEEIADNFVLLGQFINAYEIPRECIKAIMEFKIDRTIDEFGKERKGR